jgi:hypothetical protein
MRMDIFDVDHGACAVLEAPAFASRSTPPPALDTAPAPACSQGSVVGQFEIGGIWREGAGYGRMEPCLLAQARITTSPPSPEGL